MESKMLANQINTKEKAETLAGRRCFACLTGADSSKRDCAIRRLLGEGLAKETIQTAIPSSKRAH
jgi:hypothetical protein